MKTLKLSIPFALLSGVFVSAAAPLAQFPGLAFPPGGPMGAERQVLKDYDKNKDGWLNAAERKSARDYVVSSGGGFGFGGRGGRGFFGAAAEKGATLKPSDVKSYPSVPLYDETILRTLFFTFESNDWEKELEDFHGTDVDVPATLDVDGKTYRDVGVHFRGNSSFMMVPEGRKRSLNVSFDMAHGDQTLGGYKTLNLLNSNEDPTFLRAVLFLHIAREYVPAPKANLVRVVINGENWGIYANVQQFNKDFLKENFKETTGARWKAPGSPGSRSGLEYLGDNGTAYKPFFEIKTKDDPAQWNALAQLTKVLNQTPPDQLERALSSILDVDGALRFLALDNALVNNDGYWTRASDYSLYRDASGKFHILPHDTNETFAVGGGFGGPRGGGPPGPPDFFGNRGGRGPGGPGGPGGGGPELDPLVGLNDSGKPLRSKLLAVPALRERYMKYVREISAKWLDWKTLGPLVQRYQTLIDDDVKRDTKKLESYEEFVSGIAGPTRSLKYFAERRSAVLNR
jgi:spore coat protein CotH